MNVPLVFPCLHTLQYASQPILFRGMDAYWENEVHLFQGFNELAVRTIEEAFATTTATIQFSINPSTQPINAPPH
jgi:hypothetical protein